MGLGQVWNLEYILQHVKGENQDAIFWDNISPFFLHEVTAAIWDTIISCNFTPWFPSLSKSGSFVARCLKMHILGCCTRLQPWKITFSGRGEVSQCEITRDWGTQNVHCALTRKNRMSRFFQYSWISNYDRFSDEKCIGTVKMIRRPVKRKKRRLIRAGWGDLQWNSNCA